MDENTVLSKTGFLECGLWRMCCFVFTELRFPGEVYFWCGVLCALPHLCTRDHVCSLHFLCFPGCFFVCCVWPCTPLWDIFLATRLILDIWGCWGWPSLGISWPGCVVSGILLRYLVFSLQCVKVGSWHLECVPSMISPWLTASYATMGIEFGLLRNVYYHVFRASILFPSYY